MEYLCASAGCGLLSSLILNIVLIHRLYKHKREKSLTVDAQALMHDLTAYGHSVVKVLVVNPADILLRSPRT